METNGGGWWRKKISTIVSTSLEKKPAATDRMIDIFLVLGRHAINSARPWQLKILILFSYWTKFRRTHIHCFSGLPLAPSMVMQYCRHVWCLGLYCTKPYKLQLKNIEKIEKQKHVLLIHKVHKRITQDNFNTFLKHLTLNIHFFFLFYVPKSHLCMKQKLRNNGNNKRKTVSHFIFSA